MINGEPVWSLDPASPHIAQIVSTSNYDSNRDQIRDVIYQGNLIGTLRLHARVDANGMHLQDSLGVQQTWLGGSTNSPMGWMVYERNSSPLSAQTARAGGIEDSRDTDTNTNRRNTFQAASAFAQGDAVGAATQHGASPFLISLGDPMISRQSNNPTVSGTNYDAGQGKTIFTETEKSISKTVPFDLDRDGQKDLLIVYTDGSARILKNE
ncbi:hypothetical protein KBC03_03505 [Patescibacteria group bacterium]|nr:hypothetical protein [Patescibacteria group bacterium]